MNFYLKVDSQNDLDLSANFQYSPILDSVYHGQHVKALKILKTCENELTDTSLHWNLKSVLYKNTFYSTIDLMYPIETVKQIWLSGYAIDPHTYCRDYRLEYNRALTLNYPDQIPFLSHLLFFRENIFFDSLCNNIDRNYDPEWIRYSEQLEMHLKNNLLTDKLIHEFLLRIDSLGKYPGRKMVGLNSEETGAEIIKSLDSKDIKKYLPLLEESVHSKDLNPIFLAIVIDELQAKQGKPQIYGTKYSQIANEKKLYPVANPDELNKRRREAGLYKLDHTSTLIDIIQE